MTMDTLDNKQIGQEINRICAMSDPLMKPWIKGELIHLWRTYMKRCFGVVQDLGTLATPKAENGRFTLTLKPEAMNMMMSMASFELVKAIENDLGVFETDIVFSRATAGQVIQTSNLIRSSHRLQ